MSYWWEIEPEHPTWEYFVREVRVGDIWAFHNTEDNFEWFQYFRRLYTPYTGHWGQTLESEALTGRTLPELVRTLQNPNPVTVAASVSEKGMTIIGLVARDVTPGPGFQLPGVEAAVKQAWQVAPNIMEVDLGALGEWLNSEGGDPDVDWTVEYAHGTKLLLDFDKGTYWFTGRPSGGVRKRNPSFFRRTDEGVWQFKHPDVPQQDWTAFEQELQRALEEDYQIHQKASLKLSWKVEEKPRPKFAVGDHVVVSPVADEEFHEFIGTVDRASGPPDYTYIVLDQEGNYYTVWEYQMDLYNPGLHQHLASLKLAGQDPELEAYEPHKPALDDETLAKIHQQRLGELGGRVAWVVDGEMIRNNVDIDFTTGGNGGRYRFIPEQELWIELQPNTNDMAANLLHEYVESDAMILNGEGYDQAHEKASKIEQQLRDEIEAGKFQTSLGAGMVEDLTRWLSSTKLAWRMEDNVDLSTYPIATAEREDVAVDVEWRDEGLKDDEPYDSKDPNDKPLLRFYVCWTRPGSGKMILTTRRTQVDARRPYQEWEMLARYILDQVYEPVQQSASLTALCNRLSELTDVPRDVAASLKLAWQTEPPPELRAVVDYTTADLQISPDLANVGDVILYNEAKFEVIAVDPVMIEDIEKHDVFRLGEDQEWDLVQQTPELPPTETSLKLAWQVDPQVGDHVKIIAGRAALEAIGISVNAPRIMGSTGVIVASRYDGFDIHIIGYVWAFPRENWPEYFEVAPAHSPPTSQKLAWDVNVTPKRGDRVRIIASVQLLKKLGIVEAAGNMVGAVGVVDDIEPEMDAFPEFGRGNLVITWRDIQWNFPLEGWDRFLAIVTPKSKRARTSALAPVLAWEVLPGLKADDIITTPEAMVEAVGPNQVWRDHLSNFLYIARTDVQAHIATPEELELTNADRRGGVEVLQPGTIMLKGRAVWGSPEDYDFLNTVWIASDSYPMRYVGPYQLTETSLQLRAWELGVPMNRYELIRYLETRWQTLTKYLHDTYGPEVTQEQARRFLLDTLAADGFRLEDDIPPATLDAIVFGWLS